jgi:hypothetical protein
MLESGHNVYQNVLFSMLKHQKNVVEQKSLLLESFEYIKKSSEDEDKLKRIILENAAAIKIANHLMNFDEKGPNVLQKSPLNLMDKTIDLKKTNVPPKPIMVSRTSTTITMRLLILDQLQNIKTENISKISLSGKESDRVAVSLNNLSF